MIINTIASILLELNIDESCEDIIRSLAQVIIDLDLMKEDY
ncbi:hypothetical protein [Syntrophomonas palmitatica]|nr:hypothetical protein [Syntrophomonas palmitatica]